VAFFGRFFGRAGSEAAGIALGATAVPALLPAAQFIVNEAWKLHPDRPPDAYILAQGVAQGQVDPDSAREWAHEQGISDGAFAALVNTANVGPALGEAYRAWRRGELTPDQFVTATKRLGIEDQWVPALMALKQEPLDPAQIATAVHRNIMRDSSLIVREPPTTAGKVPQVPESSLDPANEATWSGIDHERLRVLVGITGLPPGLVQMLQLLNRDEVTEDDVRRSVAQSNLRNEYMDVVLALRRHLLTPHEYEEAALRGIMGRDAADAGAALSGMEKQDAQLLFEIMGRPLSVHQITTGLARGGTFGGTYADIPEPFRDAVRRSNIRPEYAKLAYANRYTIPSYFVLRALMQSGALTEAEGADYFQQLGWPPTLADAAAAAFAGGTTSTTDPLIRSARTALVTALRRAFVLGDEDEAAARALLAAESVSAATIDTLIATWTRERSITRKELTPTQLKKALGEGITNPATGAPFTVDEVIAELVVRGYSSNDARVFIET
jgi:hypothetical protein